MTISQPVQRVIDVLEGAGYAALSSPVTIAGIPFEFPAVLVGRTSLDLIVVLDTVSDNDGPRTGREIEAVSRALDVVASRRPLTVVFVGPRPERTLHQQLTRVARVLLVGSPAVSHQLHDALAVLLPLELHAGTEAPTSWAAAKDGLLERHADVDHLVAAARDGRDAVADALRAHLLAGIGNFER